MATFINTDGNAFFNAIMGKIEPELTDDVRPTLAEKYKNETPEEQLARNERYKQAFEEYDKQFIAFTTQASTLAGSITSGIADEVESVDRTHEEHELDSLITSMQTT